MVQESKLRIDVLIDRAGNVVTLKFLTNQSDVVMIELLPALMPVFETRELFRYYIGNPVAVLLPDDTQTQDEVFEIIYEVVQAIAKALSFDRDTEVDLTFDDDLVSFLENAARIESEQPQTDGFFDQDPFESGPIPLFPR